jgi:galactose mutarotase-like enzyme
VGRAEVVAGQSLTRFEATPLSHTVRDTIAAGYPAIALASATLEATFVPSLGMIGCSLRHRGEELLGQRGGLKKYAASGSTMGIPLLYPWANRLDAYTYRAAGRDVTIDPANPRLHRDGNGLPMHGLLAALPGWSVREQAADATSARLTARFTFTDAVLLAAFPFPHLLTIDVTLREATLTIATTLHANASVPVPVGFGFHPYLTLPDVDRADWQIGAAVGQHLPLDARGIPTGAREAGAIAAGPLGPRTFDDLYAVDAGAQFTLAGGGRQVTVTFEDGYPYAQLYAPAGEPVICFEPMTAPTNALISGDGLRAVAPGTSFAAAFSIAVA